MLMLSKVQLTTPCLVTMTAVLTIAWAQRSTGTESEADVWRDPYHIYDYKNHTCRRPCMTGERPKSCKYYFLLERFTTMASSCYGCPGNQTDCFLPHCVPATGVSRGLLTANRMVPGPTIDVCKGDTIEVMVDNRMEMGEGTSIHWHGLKQHGSPHMDGTNLVTQCPIHTWSKMTYRFEAKDPGTHFWHAHSTIQRADGLFGGLIIRIPQSLDPHGNLYDHDLPEHYIILNDWSHTMAGEALVKDIHSGERAEPNSILVNGLGSVETGPSMPYPLFVVKEGLRYRFRVAYNGVFNCPILVIVDDHSLLMIASDGHNFEPVNVDAFMIFSGERYDFVLKAKQGVQDNFWIRFKGHGRCTLKVLQLAILRYDGAPEEEPPGKPTYFSTVEEGLEVLNAVDSNSTNNTVQVVDLNYFGPEFDEEVLSKKPDKQFYISLAASVLKDERLAPPPMADIPVRPVNHQMNYITSSLPPSPPLSQYGDIPDSIWCNNETVKVDCSQVFCRCAHLLSFDMGDIVEIVLVSFTITAIHPMHLHGHSFRVISMYKFYREITVDEVKAMDKRGEIPRRTSQAPLKDSIAANVLAVTILRFRANNPGFWFFHCHLEFHSELGMSLIFRAGDPLAMPKPPKGFPTCHAWTPQNENGFISTIQEASNQSHTAAENSTFSLLLLLAVVLILSVVVAVVVGVYWKKRRQQKGLSEQSVELTAENYASFH